MAPLCVVVLFIVTLSIYERRIITKSCKVVVLFESYNGWYGDTEQQNVNNGGNTSGNILLNIKDVVFLFEHDLNCSNAQ